MFDYRRKEQTELQFFARYRTQPIENLSFSVQITLQLSAILIGTGLRRPSCAVMNISSLFAHCWFYTAV